MFVCFSVGFIDRSHNTLPMILISDNDNIITTYIRIRSTHKSKSHKRAACSYATECEKAKVERFFPCKLYAT